MKLAFRKRAAKPIGYRINQWKGSRAVQAENQRQRARRSRLSMRCHRLLQVVGCLAGLASVLWGGMAAIGKLGPMIQRGLEIRDVRVEGIHQVTKQEILERLSLKQGTALHQVSLPYLAERLQAHPWIKEAALERRPLHQLFVMIEERKPAAIARTTVEHILTDEEGVVLARLGERDETALPLLTGMDQKALLQGDRRLKQRIQSSIDLAKRMAHSLEARIEIDLSHPVNLVASTKGVRFHFGSDALMDQWDRFMKVKAASKMTAFEDKRREVSEVDLRYDNRVIVRERG